MKKLLVLFIILFIAVIFIFLSKHNKSTAEVIYPERQAELYYNQQLSAMASSILNGQHVTALNKLDCGKITDSQFTTIGDTFMDMMFGSGQMNKHLSETVDPQTLKQSYIQIGKYYLTCPNNWTATFPSPQTQQQYGETFYKKIDAVLQSQHVNSVKQLDCQKITDTQFITVGDAQMDLMIGNDAVHAKIDKLVGGKNLHNLESAHIQAGEFILGCAN